MRQAALMMIRAYKRWVSPYKGFSCAYRTHTGGDSCSSFACRAIERHGLMRGVMLLRRRLRRCGDVHARNAPAVLPYRPRSQAGDCDPGCDLLDLDCGSRRSARWCQAADCCSSGCDIFDWQRKRRAENERKRAQRC